MKLVIYLPVLNEEENIKNVIASLPGTLDQIDSIQILVIDDGSTDGSVLLAQSLGVDVVVHRRNRGVGAVFQSAVQFALENNADILVGIDADGQFDPAEIPDLIKPILANQADMVMGTRFLQGMPLQMPRLKYWGNKLITGVISFIGGQKFQDVSCGFRAYGREALMRLNLFSDFTYTHEAILSLIFQGLKVVECPIKVKYFPERKSRVAGSIIKYAIQTSKIILRVFLDYKPIYAFGSVGMAFITVGVAFILFLFGHYAHTQNFSPYKYTGLIGFGFFIFGMLMLIIALLADILNRLRINQDEILYLMKTARYKK